MQNLIKCFSFRRINLLIIFISTYFCSPVQTISQYTAPLSSHDELITRIYPSDEYSFSCHLIAQSKVWTWNTKNQNYPITNEYNNPQEPFQREGITEEQGFEFPTSLTGTGHDIFGFGLYKVTISTTNNSYLGNNAYFYIDFRDDQYGKYMPNIISSGYQVTDIYLKYNYYEDYFLINFEGGDDIGFEKINNGELLRVWEGKGLVVPPSTDEFGNNTGISLDDFWQNSLVLLSKNNNPWLIWAQHPNPNTSNYKIYRAISQFPVNNPIMLNYDLISTIYGNNYEYIDDDILLNNSGEYVYYYVRSNISSTVNSNFVNTKGYFYKKNENISDNNEILNFRMENNYPNPFNPSTVIKYQIQMEGLVTLNVYNSLGEKV